MIPPASWWPRWAIIVTKCEINPVGGTDFEVTFCGAPIAFTLDDVQVGEAPGQRGLDDVRSLIEGVVGDQIETALRLAR